MSYVLGYITADGCISIDRKRKNKPFLLNITSVNKNHLYKIKKAFNTDNKIGQKLNGSHTSIAYQFQTRNQIICKDLIKLGILPRKTYNLKPIKIPDRYFADFVRGFFDGDGSIYIYKVNNTPQIKIAFVNTSYNFIKDLNKQICKKINIPKKTINKQNKKTNLYYIYFYIDDCKKLSNFMYQDNPSLYLPRKYKLFKKWEKIKRRKYIKKNYPSKISSVFRKA